MKDKIPKPKKCPTNSKELDALDEAAHLEFCRYKERLAAATTYADPKLGIIKFVSFAEYCRKRPDLAQEALETFRFLAHDEFEKQVKTLEAIKDAEQQKNACLNAWLGCKTMLLLPEPAQVLHVFEEEKDHIRFNTPDLAESFRRVLQELRHVNGPETLAKQYWTMLKERKE